MHARKEDPLPPHCDAHPQTKGRGCPLPRRPPAYRGAVNIIHSMHAAAHEILHLSLRTTRAPEAGTSHEMSGHAVTCAHILLPLHPYVLLPSWPTRGLTKRLHGTASRTGCLHGCPHPWPTRGLTGHIHGSSTASTPLSDWVPPMPLHPSSHVPRWPTAPTATARAARAPLALAAANRRN
jgi:hypothetical protein